MTNILGLPTRRSVLLGAAAGAATLAMPGILRAQDRSLKVGVYGGYFKDSFDENVFPAFTKATGIAVEGIAEPTGEAWLVQLEQAARANVAPADVSMISQVAMRKGLSTELWAPLDLKRIARSEDILPQFLVAYPDGRTAASGRWPGTSTSSPTRKPIRRRPIPGQRSGTRPTRASSAFSRSSRTRSFWR